MQRAQGLANPDEAALVTEPLWANLCVHAKDLECVVNDALDAGVALGSVGIEGSACRIARVGVTEVRRVVVLEQPHSPPCIKHNVNADDLKVSVCRRGGDFWSSA